MIRNKTGITNIPNLKKQDVHMRLHEYEGTDLFEQYKIPVPGRAVADTVETALSAAGAIGYPVVAKAQVLVGGRGLAGGIKTADTPEELESAAAQLLDSQIKGLAVKELMITKKVDIKKELYMGITIDGYNGRPVAVVSTEGGVHVEKAAKDSPGKIASAPIDPDSGFYPYQAHQLVRQLNLPWKTAAGCAGVLVKLYQLFCATEAVITEINPLAVLEDGSLMAVDSVVEIDDSAVYRVKEKLPLKSKNRHANALEQKGRQIGVTYVDLDGEIGLISSGAGLGMASMDIIGNKLTPANFLETGGGITADLLYQCMDLVLQKPLKAIFINIYGGINPIHEGAKGVVRYIKEHNVALPIVAKALGNHQEETWEILKSGGVHVVTQTATERAVDKLIDLLQQ